MPARWCAPLSARSILISGPLTLKGLIATVIGGLDSVPGAIVAGLLVGALENVAQHFHGVTEYFKAISEDVGTPSQSQLEVVAPCRIEIAREEGWRPRVASNPSRSPTRHERAS